MNPKYESKYFVNQNDVPEWWTAQDDKDVEDAINEKPIVFSQHTEPTWDRSEEDILGDDYDD